MDKIELVMKMLEKFEKSNAEEHAGIMARIDKFEDNFIMINFNSLKKLTISKKQGTGLAGAIIFGLGILNQAGVV